MRGGVEGYVYEGGGRGEGVAVEVRYTGCERCALGGAEGGGMVDFVEGHGE